VVLYGCGAAHLRHELQEERAPQAGEQAGVAEEREGQRDERRASLVPGFDVGADGVQLVRDGLGGHGLLAQVVEDLGGGVHVALFKEPPWSVLDLVLERGLFANGGRAGGGKGAGRRFWEEKEPAMKMAAGPHWRRMEPRHPQYLPASEVQNVMPYPTLRRVSFSQDLGVMSRRHIPQTRGQSGNEPDVVGRDKPASPWRETPHYRRALGRGAPFRK
ncbi:hypothetical protein J3459_007969, partial [Metarhizium acridum]